MADDHPSMLEAATTILQDQFDVVATASRGDDAVAAHRTHQPDAMVLDIAMPGLNGLQVAARLRANGSRARIVFLSNHTDDDIVLAAFRQGASGFVGKAQMGRDLVAAMHVIRTGGTFVPSCRVLRRWKPRPGRHHDLQFYSSDAFLIEIVTDHLSAALHVGDSVIAVVTGQHRPALETRLIERGIDIEALAHTGRYQWVDAELGLEAMLRNGVPDRDLFNCHFDGVVDRAVAAAIGRTPHVTAFGESAPLLCARGQLDAMVQAERIADEYTSVRPLSLLCAYPMQCFQELSRGHLDALSGTHAATIPPADFH